MAKQGREQFRDGLRALGHVEGRTVRLEFRWAHGDDSRFPALAKELISQKPVVIVSVCGTPQRAIREVSRTVPIVGACADQTNFLGEVATLRRPGGATTGFLFLAPESVGKRLQILKEIQPNLKRVGLVYYSRVGWETYWQEAERAAARFDLTPLRLPFEGVSDLEHVFATSLRERVEALFWFPDVHTSSAASRISDFALRHRLLTAFESDVFVDGGGLVSYAPDIPDLYHRVVPRQVDKILKGANAGDVPVEHPTKFLLVINLRTAKALGLTIPRKLLLSADRVIE